MAKRPDLEGQQFMHPGGSTWVYVVIDGVLRWIPNPTTFNRLFRNWWVGTMDLSGIDGWIGTNPLPPFPLPINSLVVQGNETPQVYLIDFDDYTNQTSPLVKRWIQSPQAMAQYNFKWPSPDVEWSSQQSVSGWSTAPPPSIVRPPTVIAQKVIDAIPAPNPPGPLPLG